MELHHCGRQGREGGRGLVSAPGGGGLVQGWGGLLPGAGLLRGGGVCLVRGGVPGLGGWWSAPGGGGLSQHALRQTPSPPSWTEFLTHACENIILAQLRCGR